MTAGDTFTITVPLTVVLMSVLGGTRHWAGPAVGATIITALLYAFTAGDHAVAGKAVFGARADRGHPVHAAGRARRRSWRAAAARSTIAARRRSPRADAVMDDETRRAGDGAAGAERILVARGIRKAFRGVRALDGVDIDVREGEILGLLGPNGSGKSTFINLVSGHYRPDGGELVFAGEDIAHHEAHRIARAGVARTYQIPRPFEHLTVIDNVAVPAMFGAAHLDRARRIARGPAMARIHRTSRTRRSGCPRTSTCTSGSFWSLPARSRRGRGSCCWTKCSPGSRRPKSTGRSA